jgi:hypothetical protein
MDRARGGRRRLERGRHLGNVARQAFTVHMGQPVALNSHVERLLSGSLAGLVRRPLRVVFGRPEYELRCRIAVTR